MSSDLSFELTDNTKVNASGVTLYQIRATRDIPARGVRKGDLGGWIESAELPDGVARVSGDAEVYGNARVYGNAWVSGDAEVYGDARVYGNAWVYGNARVFGNARVSGNAWVSGNARVSGDARVYGNAWVSGNARVSGDARVYGPSDYFVMGPIGSENVYATLVRTETGHLLTVGCWTDGTLGTLMKEVKRRRKAYWRADEATQTLWMEQYRALKRIGETIAASWAETEK